MPAPAREKRLFHQVISRMLHTAPIGINNDLNSAKATEVLTLLSILQQSKMPATTAHEIANAHNYLPEMLKEVGLTSLADCAEEVLTDLVRRRDEA